MAARSRLPISLTAATTRAVPASGGRRPPLLETGQLVTTPDTRLEFRIGRMIGAGGFGEVYLARRVGRSATVPGVVCIKASAHIDGWLREAYFGQLLDDHPRAIRVFDAFPLARRDGSFVYCLVLDAPVTAISAHSWSEVNAGRNPPCGARWRESSRCSGSCTAASCCTATSRRSTSSSVRAHASSSATSASSGSRAIAAGSPRGR